MQIEIKSRPIGLHFGYSWYKSFINSLYQFREKLMDDRGFYTGFGLAKSIQAAYENHCLLKDIEPVIGFDDILEWVDISTATEEGKVQLIAISEAMATNTHLKKLIEETQSEKKSQETTLSNQTGTPLNPSVTENSGSDLGNSGE